MHWAYAASICAGFAVAETLLAARKPAQALRSLRQPRWSPPLWLWAVIGAAWYLICFLALARILPRLNDAPLPASLLLALMAANALWGAVLFRLKRYDLAFWLLLPYAAILLGFIVAVRPVDHLSSMLFAAYGGYLAYAAVWSWHIFKLNPHRGLPP